MVNPLFWAGQQILTSGYFDMWDSDANLRSWMWNQRNPSDNESPQPSEEHLAVPSAFPETESDTSSRRDKVQGSRRGTDGWVPAWSPEPGTPARKRWCPHITIPTKQQQFLLGLAWGGGFCLVWHWRRVQWDGSPGAEPGQRHVLPDCHCPWKSGSHCNSPHGGGEPTLPLPSVSADLPPACAPPRELGSSLLGKVLCAGGEGWRREWEETAKALRACPWDTGGVCAPQEWVSEWMNEWVNTCVCV